jgi:iron complex outermembrane receptor protein
MTFPRLARAALLCGALHSVPAFATDATDAARGESILVIAQKQAETIENAPSTRASVDAARIAETVNAMSTEDTLKYLPSLIVRKRHIGDNFAPIATRTSGLGSSARSLIYADGALLSALIANNNGNGSPRWSLVAPEEIERIDVLYGPFSAAYSGNSIGTVVSITTRLPDKLEARASILTNVQQYSLYGTDSVLPSWQYSGSLGDRFGPLSLFASATRTTSNGQPISFITATSQPAGTTGGYADRNRTGGAIRVLGAGGIEHHVQDTFKLKAALDLSPSVRAIYVVGLWRDDSQGTVQSYLSPTTSATTPFTAGFSSGVYTRDAEHWSHALTVQGDSERIDWQLVGTLYDYGHDIQRTPTGLLPNAFAGGAGIVQRQDGNGWATLDAKASLHLGEAHVLSGGGHFDRYTLGTTSYLTPDWTSAAQGALSAVSRGKTSTAAVWAQDAWSLTPTMTLTLGARYEWWRAYDGYNLSATAPQPIVQPSRRAHGVSPKASLEWRPAPAWSARLSFGQAYRFPTVGELYQAVTVGTLLTNPNPNLLPERARSEELAVEHRDTHGSIRLSLFNESIANALISQTGMVGAATATFVQNVDLTRARGVELALDRRDVLPGWDLSGSVTYADATTRRNTGDPSSIGKLLPSVPHWKATAVLSWRPDPKLVLTTAARMSSRNYGTLNNSDTIGNTYQGFDKYVVVDARALVHVTDQFDVAVGVDNIGNDTYFLFHPFPQRSFTLQASWKL